MEEVPSNLPEKILGIIQLKINLLNNLNSNKNKISNPQKICRMETINELSHEDIIDSPGNIKEVKDKLNYNFGKEFEFQENEKGDIIPEGRRNNDQKLHYNKKNNQDNSNQLNICSEQNVYDKQNNEKNEHFVKEGKVEIDQIKKDFEQFKEEVLNISSKQIEEIKLDV